MAAWGNDPVVETEAQPQAPPWEHDPVAEPTPTEQPRGLQEVGQALQERPSASKLFSRQSLSDIISGADLKSVPMDVLKSLTPITEAPRAIKQAIDLVRGVPAEQAVPGIGELKGIEQKPLRERLSTGLDVATQLAFAGTIGEGLTKPASLHESLFGKTEGQPLASETAAVEQIQKGGPSATEPNRETGPLPVEQGKPTQQETAVQPETRDTRETPAEAPAQKVVPPTEPTPVLEVQPSTTAETLTQEKGGEVGEKVQVQGEDEGKGKEGVLTPEAATVQTPAAPTGISNERLKEIYGDDAIIAGKGRGPQEWQRIGQADTRDPYAVLSKAKERGIAPPEDVALLRAEHQRLANAAREAYGTERYNELAQNATDMANSIKGVAHGPASDVMRALQDVDIPKYDSPADFDRIVRERMNRESTPEEKSTFEKVTQEVRNGDSEVKSTASEAQNRLARYRPKETISFEDAIKHVKDQITELTTNCNL